LSVWLLDESRCGVGRFVGGSTWQVDGGIGVDRRGAHNAGPVACDPRGPESGGDDVATV